MKIGIFTFHRACNYGAVLQCYALQEYLKNMGHDVSVIDYAPEYIEKPYRPFRYSYNRMESPLVNAKVLFRQILLIPIRIKQRLLFNAFLKKHLNLSELDLSNPENSYDSFIMGSDQIWNAEITGGELDKVYFGHFPAAKGKKIISYGASAGTIALGGNVEQLVAYAGNLHGIGARERNLFELLRHNLSDNFVRLTIDPTLLVGRDCLDKITVEKKPISKYLLVFQLKSEDTTDMVAKRIALEKNLKLVRVSQDDYIYKLLLFQDRPVLSVGEFLWYFANADYVVTSSFHGTALSIVYGKNFNAVVNDDKKGERIRELLADLNLSDRIIDKSLHFATDTVRYDSALLEPLRRSAGMFLKQVLSQP